MKILVIDDHPANLKLAGDVLEWQGHEVARAVDANDALASISMLRPDVILMDIELPGMDGLQLTRQLKGDSTTGSIPIIALTAYAMKGDEEKALSAGCDGYLTKPINTRTLGRQIAEIVASASLSNPS